MDLVEYSRFQQIFRIIQFQKQFFIRILYILAYCGSFWYQLNLNLHYNFLMIVKRLFVIQAKRCFIKHMFLWAKTFCCDILHILFHTHHSTFTGIQDSILIFILIRSETIFLSRMKEACKTSHVSSLSFVSLLGNVTALLFDIFLCFRILFSFFVIYLF